MPLLVQRPMVHDDMESSGGGRTSRRLLDQALDEKESAMVCVGPEFDADRYELDELADAGAEGVVWRGSLRVDGRRLPVAVKVLVQDDGDIGAWTERWERQAELLRSLDHPNLVRVRECFRGPAPHERGACGARGQALYLVMNWVDGVSLVEWSRSQFHSLAARLSVVSQLASAVEYLHDGAATGGIPIVHRDVKPANVMVSTNPATGAPHVRLLDFGFARFADRSMSAAGTPVYIAPEVLAGASPTPASDVYSLGATVSYVLAVTDIVSVGSARAALERVPGVGDPDRFARTAVRSLANNPVDRPRKLSQWANELAGAAGVSALPVSFDGVSFDSFEAPRPTTFPTAATFVRADFVPGAPEPVRGEREIADDGQARPRWLLPLLAGALAALIAVPVGLLALARSDDRAPVAAARVAAKSLTRTQPTTTSTTVDPKVKELAILAQQHDERLRGFVTSMETILQQSQNGRADLGSVISAISQGCGTAPQDASLRVQTVIANRESVLNQLAGMSLPDGVGEAVQLKALSQTALQSSINADNYYRQWFDGLAADYGTYGNEYWCPSGAPTIAYPAVAQAHQADGVSTAAKQAFVDTFNPIAGRFSLPTWSGGQI